MEKDSNLASPQDDGAGEKLVDEKNGHNSKGIEVKYITPSSQNGDAKIDIENLKSAFAGMGKEELMKFASDPFWVRTRWFLFILFWLLWAAMLAGAIAIIILAPKCGPPTPREWWEQSPLYKANVATFTKDSSKLQGDLKGFTTKLEYLSSLGVKTVVLSNILKVSDKESDGVDEFKTVAPSFGTLEDLKALISAAKDKGLKLLLTLIPNHSSLKSDLFNKSASKDPLYESFYIWAPGKGFTSEGMPAPPNNWPVCKQDNIIEQVVRIIAKLNNRESCRSAFRELNLLTLSSMAVIYLETRAWERFRARQHRTAAFDRIAYQARIKFMNSLPETLNLETNTTKFKTQLKHYLVSCAFYSVSEFMEHT
ncbi:hypothetical protein J6590_055404 [Homalodisca vitripennis]|nr:hypothetical protein J6590_055404 [Homalodisca vitripennis]